MQEERNTKFFNLSTLVRRKRNKIIALLNKVRQWFYEQSELRNFFNEYFNHLNAPLDNLEN